MAHKLKPDTPNICKMKKPEVLKFMQDKTKQGHKVRSFILTGSWGPELQKKARDYRRGQDPQ